MKTGTHIRFKVANYAAGHKLIEVTGEVAEGKVVRSDGDGLLVRVEGHELPFYVAPGHIIEEGDGEE